MPLNPSGRVITTPDVLLQELEGDAVLLNLANGQYYGMDENSFLMYRTLISSPSIQTAYKTLLLEYEIDPEQLEADLEQFISSLIDNGLVTHVDDQSG
jgi:hypothetical protein